MQTYCFRFYFRSVSVIISSRMVESFLTHLTNYNTLPQNIGFSFFDFSHPRQNHEVSALTKYMTEHDITKVVQLLRRWNTALQDAKM